MRSVHKHVLGVTLGLGVVLVLSLLLSGAAYADTEILDNTTELFRSAVQNWYARLFPFARNLFLLLMTIEVAWTSIELVLQGDFEIGKFFRRVLAVLFFFVVLENSRQWLPTVVESFIALGTRAAFPGASGSITATGILNQGLALANVIGGNASSLFGVFSTNALIYAFAECVVLLSFGAIALQFMLAVVESYIVLGGGVVLLGFAGSRWSIGYTERFLGYAVGVGVKLFVLTLIVGTGSGLAVSWFTTLQTGELKDAVAVALASFVFLGLTFAAPGIASALQGGASALGLGSLLSGATLVTQSARSAGATARTVVQGARVAAQGAVAAGSASAALYRAAVNAGRGAVR